MKVVLLTGGTRGIGKGILDDLRQDHRVAYTWRSTPPGTAQTGTHAIRADLSNPSEAEDIIANVIHHFGQLDVIVNNAGAIGTSPLDTHDPDNFRTQYDVNLGAPVALLAAALPHLKPGASVVNISSVNAVLPPMGAAIYGATKAALNLWTQGAAKELGPKGIRVNAIAPGAIEREESPRDPELVQKFIDMTALGRVGTPQDIAQAVRFLASDAASFITGEVLTVSGGYRL